MLAWEYILFLNGSLRQGTYLDKIRWLGQLIGIYSSVPQFQLTFYAVQIHQTVYLAVLKNMIVSLSNISQRQIIRRYSWNFAKSGAKLQ